MTTQPPSSPPTVASEPPAPHIDIDIGLGSSSPAGLGFADVGPWRDLAGVLAPIIGRGGVAALFERSLYLTIGAHPGLATARGDSTTEDGFTALATALEQHASAASAAASNRALLQTFCDLLSRLIGAPLTQRLLASTRQTPSHEDRRETSP